MGYGLPSKASRAAAAAAVQDPWGHVRVPDETLRRFDPHGRYDLRNPPASGGDVERLECVTTREKNRGHAGAQKIPGNDVEVSVLLLSPLFANLLLGVVDLRLDPRLSYPPIDEPTGAWSRWTYTQGGYIRSIGGVGARMHTVREREKLVARVRRIRGQIEAVERALVEEKGCYDVLQTVTAARGALNSLVAEMIEDHVRYHVLDPEEKVSPKRARAADELIDIVRAYVK